jgi:exodeoxyribonuclease-5
LVRRPLLVAPTGKAVDVLLRRGAPPDRTSTIHRAIYEANYDTRRRCWTRRLRDCDELGADLIIVDEASMVGEALAGDLLSFGIPVIAVGDPMQLPPVGDREGFFVQDRPDAFLTQIHRQAADNGIYRLAHALYRGDGHRYDFHDGTMVANVGTCQNPEDFDVILCGTKTALGTT